MLTKTFLLLDGVQHQKETQLWNQGIATWDTFVRAPHIKGISAKRKTIYNLQLQHARHALRTYDLHYFAQLLPPAHHWRLFNHFRDEAVYLDIETNNRGEITVLGCYDGDRMMTLVKGKNLHAQSVQQLLDHYQLIVTFNGGSFDLPKIKKEFAIDLTQAHIDLRHVCSKVGLVGGLKKIEKKLNIRREDEVKQIKGGDAALLWRMYRGSGNERYLKLLIDYNCEDTLNLERLAYIVIPRLQEQVLSTTNT